MLPIGSKGVAVLLCLTLLNIPIPLPAQTLPGRPQPQTTWLDQALMPRVLWVRPISPAGIKALAQWYRTLGDTQRDIVLTLGIHPELTQQGLAVRLEKNKSTISAHYNKLLWGLRTIKEMEAETDHDQMNDPVKRAAQLLFHHFLKKSQTSWLRYRQADPPPSAELLGALIGWRQALPSKLQETFDVLVQGITKYTYIAAELRFRPRGIQLRLSEMTQKLLRDDHLRDSFDQQKIPVRPIAAAAIYAGYLHHRWPADIHAQVNANVAAPIDSIASIESIQFTLPDELMTPRQEMHMRSFLMGLTRVGVKHPFRGKKTTAKRARHEAADKLDIPGTASQRRWWMYHLGWVEGVPADFLSALQSWENGLRQSSPDKIAFFELIKNGRFESERRKGPLKNPEYEFSVINRTLRDQRPLRQLASHYGFNLDWLTVAAILHAAEKFNWVVPHPPTPVFELYLRQYRFTRIQARDLSPSEEQLLRRLQTQPYDPSMEIPYGETARALINQPEKNFVSIRSFDFHEITALKRIHLIHKIILNSPDARRGFILPEYRDLIHHVIIGSPDPTENNRNISRELLPVIKHLDPLNELAYAPSLFPSLSEDLRGPYRRAVRIAWPPEVMEAVRSAIQGFSLLFRIPLQDIFSFQKMARAVARRQSDEKLFRLDTEEDIQHALGMVEMRLRESPVLAPLANRFPLNYMFARAVLNSSKRIRQSA